ncbi:MAG: hypothetical protein Ct9H300mP27_09430 [Chloroflexota bacterium]|nr:MAG: hypothetical protein Ct9H300mP27_09430 [Chloroflexota bacterium]
MILVSSVMMVGGAGRDMGVNLAYLGPHFKKRFGFNYYSDCGGIDGDARWGNYWADILRMAVGQSI